MQPFTEATPEDLYLAWELTLTGDVSEADIAEVFEWVEDECDLAITSLGGENEAVSEPVPAPAQQAVAPTAAPVAAVKAKAPSKPKPKPKKAPEAASIRVGIDKVDEIIIVAIKQICQWISVRQPI